jgi:uncharacterized protein (DUF2164 family)
MADIEFTAEEKAIIVGKIQRYFTEELQQKIGRFDAEFLLDFLADEVGAYFYNRGIYDAQAALSRMLDDLNDLITQLERPTDFQK